MDKRAPVFIDTSGFKALVDPLDEFHAVAVKKWEDAKRLRIPFLTSNYILDESYTLLRVRCGRPAALLLAGMLRENVRVVGLARVTARDEYAAWAWFEKDWRNLSFTDCASFALMERLGLSRVFGFDAHFERAGFQLL